MGSIEEKQEEFDLFLSHATPDKEWVLALAERLEARGLRVFVDSREIWVRFPVSKWTDIEPQLGEKLSREDRADIVARQIRVHQYSFPTYFYEDKTRVRCVFGRVADEQVAACKLQYTGWFPMLRPTPPVEKIEPAKVDPAE